MTLMPPTQRIARDEHGQAVVEFAIVLPLITLLLFAVIQFGITYNTASTDKTYGWFDDHPDANYTTDTTSPIVWAGHYGAPSSSKGVTMAVRMTPNPDTTLKVSQPGAIPRQLARAPTAHRPAP